MESEFKVKISGSRRPGAKNQEKLTRVFLKLIFLLFSNPIIGLVHQCKCPNRVGEPLSIKLVRLPLRLPCWDNYNNYRPPIIAF